MYIDPHRYTTRPADDRLPQEFAIYDKLEELDIPYVRVDHDHADTIEFCQEVEAVLGGKICKNLFLCNRQRTKFYLLMMPGGKVFKTRDLSPLIGSSRLSFAGAEDMEKYLDITPGSVSIMGLMNDTENHVQLLMDRAVAESPMLGCHPCVNTSSLRLRTRDVFDIFLPAVHHDAIIVDLPEYPASV